MASRRARPRGVTWKLSRSVTGSDGEQPRVAAQEDLSLRNSRRCDEPFSKIVPCEDRRDPPRFHDDRLPGLAREIDLAVGRDWRREEHAVEPRLPDARPVFASAQVRTPTSLVKYSRPS